ncbi:hypothetical protein QBC35DRAFT_487239 [Podospora australis]|uniref:Uncharacterized protein n=1 Tax=Podospora australis TaxID=1536484 RepID=A0AAN7AJX9_9PEZI|nr:hypothetical protein QBC35DRAFT_487239 [Podospora australis]
MATVYPPNPDSCGCCWNDGQLWLPTTCDYCAGNMRANCQACGNTGMRWVPCPHPQPSYVQQPIRVPRYHRNAGSRSSNEAASGVQSNSS